MLYMETFTINIPQMLAYVPYMDPMGWIICPHLFEFDYDILTTLAGPDPSSPSWRHGRNGLDNVAMEWIASGLVDDTQPLGMVSLWW